MISGELEQQDNTMFRRQLLRGKSTASLFSRGPVAAEQTQQEGMRYYAPRTVTSSLAATTRAAAAAIAVALAGVGIYEALTFSAVFHEHAVAYKPPRVRLRLAHLHCRTPAGDRSLVHVDIVTWPSSDAVSPPIRHFCSSIVHRWRNYSMIVAIVRSTCYSGKGGYTPSSNSGKHSSSSGGYVRSSNGRKCCSSHSSKACKRGNSNTTSRSNLSDDRGDSTKNTDSSNCNDVVSVHKRGNSHWCGGFPSVTGALAERPLHLLEPVTTTEEEDADENETPTAEVIDLESRSSRRRGSPSRRGTRLSDYSFFRKAATQRPVTVASLAAAVFAAGVLAGAGLMALRAAEERERNAIKTADAFIEKMAAGTRSRKVERDEDSQSYSAYTQQMWNSVRLLAGTAITNAIQTLFLSLQLSPVLFLVADAGLKAGVQAWAGGSTVVSVLQHALLAGGYASAIGLLGSWQLVLLPLSVLLLYAAVGKGLKTKDSVTSGRIFAEHMPLIESRLKAEADPKARAVLAGRLFESVAREYKHKKLLDEALIRALSQTLLQLKRDLLKGLPPGQCCQLAHARFNKLLSLKFAAPTPPAGQQRNNADAAGGASSPPPPPSPS